MSVFWTRSRHFVCPSELFRFTGVKWEFAFGTGSRHNALFRETV